MKELILVGVLDRTILPNNSNNNKITAKDGIVVGDQTIMDGVTLIRAAKADGDYFYKNSMILKISK